MGWIPDGLDPGWVGSRMGWIPDGQARQQGDGGAAARGVAPGEAPATLTVLTALALLAKRYSQYYPEASPQVGRLLCSLYCLLVLALTTHDFFTTHRAPYSTGTFLAGPRACSPKPRRLPGRCPLSRYRQGSASVATIAGSAGSKRWQVATCSQGSLTILLTIVTLACRRRHHCWAIASWRPSHSSRFDE
jgi:hypothetical protein